MNKRFIHLISIFMLLLLILVRETRAEELTLKVNDMTCSSCVTAIEGSIGALQQVEKVDVDLESKVVKVETKEGAILSDEEITKVVKNAGFNASDFTRKDFTRKQEQTATN